MRKNKNNPKGEKMFKEIVLIVLIMLSLVSFGFWISEETFYNRHNLQERTAEHLIYCQEQGYGYYTGVFGDFCIVRADYNLEIPVRIYAQGVTQEVPIDFITSYKLGRSDESKLWNEIIQIDCDLNRIQGWRCKR